MNHTSDVTVTVCEAAGGEAGLVALARAWHARCLADPVVSHAFSHGDGHPQHTERLAAYWAEALGGPARFTAEIGDETEVVRMHAGQGEHAEMDERAQQCFVRALDDVGLSSDPRLRASLEDYFWWAIGTMARYPDAASDVPDGLPLARWSWDGPVS